MTIWATLGIAPTADRGAIRRAYAKALRVTNPEDDAEGFKALRAAYETALTYADHAAAWDADEDGSEEPEGSLSLTFTEGELFALLEPAPEEADDDDVAPPRPRFRSVPVAGHGYAEDLADLFAEREAETAQVRALIATLDWSLRGPWTDGEDAMRDTLAALLATPAMGEIALRADVEQVIAELIAETIPRSDAILLEAATAFGWIGALPNAVSPPVAAALARLDEWRLMETFNRPNHPLHAAWRSLTRPVKTYGVWRLSALRPGLESGVATLLGAHGAIAPGLTYAFKAAAVARWERHLARPHLTLGMFAAIPLALVLYLALNDAFDGAGPALQSPEDLAASIPWPVAAALLASPVVPLLARWGRMRWLRMPRGGWQANGWPAGPAVVLAGAMVLPESRLALAGLTLATALAWVWIAVAGGTATIAAVWKRVVAVILPVILCGMFGGGWAIAYLDPVHRAALVLVYGLGATIMVGPLTQAGMLLAAVPRWRAAFAVPIVLAVAGAAYGMAGLIGFDGDLFYASALALVAGFVIVAAAQAAGVRGTMEYRLLLAVKMALVAGFIYTAITWVEDKQAPAPGVSIPVESRPAGPTT